MSGKRRSRIPLMVVLLLFVGMGLLVFAASQWRPQPWNLPPDDPGKRMDRENNAWFALDEAAKLFGEQKAPAISNAFDRVLNEPRQFDIIGRVWTETSYRPVAMLNVRTVTDHTKRVGALRVYDIKSLGPALDKVCEAAAKPYCLDPSDVGDAAKDMAAEERGAARGSHLGLEVMAAALINSAVTMSREGRSDGKPCEYVRGWLRLTQFISPGQDVAYRPAQWNYAAETLRRADAGRQDEMLTWLVRFRQKWKPPVDTLIRTLRLMERTAIFSHLDPGRLLALVHDKRFLATGATECIKVAGMTQGEARKYLEPRVEIRRLHSIAPIEWAWLNSSALTGIDGSRAVPPTAMDERVTNALRAELEARGLPVVELPSGAGHDAGVMARAGVPSGMLFVRSLNGGVSHSPDELSSEEDVELAVDVLASVLARL